MMGAFSRLEKVCQKLKNRAEKDGDVGLLYADFFDENDDEDKKRKEDIALLELVVESANERAVGAKLVLVRLVREQNSFVLERAERDGGEIILDLIRRAADGGDEWYITWLDDEFGRAVDRGIITKLAEFLSASKTDEGAGAELEEK